MGKSTQVDGDNNPTSAESDPTKLLEAALLQMDGIIAGKHCRICEMVLLRWDEAYELLTQFTFFNQFSNSSTCSTGFIGLHFR